MHLNELHRVGKADKCCSYICPINKCLIKNYQDVFFPAHWTIVCTADNKLARIINNYKDACYTE